MTKKIQRILSDGRDQRNRREIHTFFAEPFHLHETAQLDPQIGRECPRIWYMVLE